MQDATLGIKQVQAILRIVGETAELWYDATLQRRYTLESLCRLLPAKSAVCFNYGDVLAGGKNCCGPLVQVGLNDDQATQISEYLKTGKPPDPCIAALSKQDTRVLVRRRCELVKDNAWRESDHFRNLRAPLDLDDTLYA